MLEEKAQESGGENAVSPVSVTRALEGKLKQIVRVDLFYWIVPLKDVLYFREMLYQTDIQHMHYLAWWYTWEMMLKLDSVLLKSQSLMMHFKAEWQGILVFKL